MKSHVPHALSAGQLRQVLANIDANLLNSIVSVAEPIPLWRVGLCTACHIRRPSRNDYYARPVKAGDKLPPLPLCRFRSPSKRASCQGPPSILTSTRAIGAAPDHATPRIGNPPTSTSLSVSGSLIRLRTRCSDTGSVTTCSPRCHSKKYVSVW